MMMSWLLAASMAAPSGAGEPAKIDVPAYGGGIACRQAFLDEYKEKSMVWSLGFWSGMNIARGETAGNGLDALGVRDKVKAVCTAQPTLPLISAVILARKTTLGR
ncbi:hypothetical protein [Sphingomonas crocodyli]|uniref:Uncharacterized protein n=1 Tax=Sphingomonas crocodyli TaxID=1979270 RepID=A0A437LXM6_9SPHN|nr:hypothetical protein [Sphingomonas crocodyli]RVT90175.1 hypothetical protein EOD43_17885 [Sphingomonas crocodyli]